ncbi:hypothetical protein FRC02_002785 [Tulasnella sp. 418]|nr:hypothetical protein FRC02_002785 [Tulasnella sp. 418]
MLPLLMEMRRKWEKVSRLQEYLERRSSLPAKSGKLDNATLAWITKFISLIFRSTYHSRVEESVDITLKNLGTDYLDLLLMHWPIAMNPEGNHPLFPTRPDGIRDILHDWPLINTWRQLEALYKSGKVKAIGVSNCSQLKLEEEILPEAEIIPAVNQLELHPYNPQHKLTEWLKSKGIVPEAYSPLGSTNSPLLKDEVVLEIAEKHKASPAEVLIGWGSE